MKCLNFPNFLLANHSCLHNMIFFNLIISVAKAKHWYECYVSNLASLHIESEKRKLVGSRWSHMSDKNPWHVGQKCSCSFENTDDNTPDFVKTRSQAKWCSKRYMGTHIAMRNHSAFIANGTQRRRRSNSNSKVEFQKFKCETLFTA